MFPQHLEDMIGHLKTVTTDVLCQSLVALANSMLSGSVPLELSPLIYGGSLTALLKEDGGLRPIAAGNTLRKLVAKVVSRRVKPAIRERLRPLHLG